MSVTVCAACGYRASLDYVNMVDECPSCKASPFVESESGTVTWGAYTPNPNDQPDAMNEGEHTLLNSSTATTWVCSCGANITSDVAWLDHIEVSA